VHVWAQATAAPVNAQATGSRPPGGQDEHVQRENDLVAVGMSLIAPRARSWSRIGSLVNCQTYTVKSKVEVASLYFVRVRGRVLSRRQSSPRRFNNSSIIGISLAGLIAPSSLVHPFSLSAATCRIALLIPSSKLPAIHSWHDNALRQSAISHHPRPLALIHRPLPESRMI
jgi:hypothetical protein